MTTDPIRKIFQGVAPRQQMYRMFDRHAQRPNRWEDDASLLYSGEWFEITEAEHDYMFKLMPPLWIRGSLFAMREFLTGSVTSVFFALRIDARTRFFHSYCDLSDKTSVEVMRCAIFERESQPVHTITREERLEHIWSATADAWRGYAGDSWPKVKQGQRTVMLFSDTEGTFVKLLGDLTDEEVSAKLPVHLRHVASQIAA